MTSVVSERLPTPELRALADQLAAEPAPECPKQARNKKPPVMARHDELALLFVISTIKLADGSQVKHKSARLLEV